VKTDKEVMRLIQSKCDDMSNAYVVLMPVPASADGARLQMDTVDHIGVSVSLSALAASAVLEPTGTSKESAKMAESSISRDAGHPVVYAQAVAASSRGDYQPVQADVEMV
jgi:hypothetical protein